MDEAVINGAQLFYPKQFGIGGTSRRDVLLLGCKPSWSSIFSFAQHSLVVNSAPYICCCVLGCWLTDPLNKWLGRRGTIFIAALISFLACIWQGVTNSWPHLWAARFVLGLGIGPKSATVPVYAAECAPAKIRGALVMQWQVWTAFGIMMGVSVIQPATHSPYSWPTQNVMDLAFFSVSDPPHITGLNWRLMYDFVILRGSLSLQSVGWPRRVSLPYSFSCRCSSAPSLPGG